MTTRHILCAAASVALGASLVAQTAREATITTNTGNALFDNVIATEGGLSAIAYSENGPVKVQTSDGNGKTWSAAVTVDQDGSNARKDLTRKNLIVANGVLYICWRDQRNGGNDIYFSSSADGGLTWTPEVLVFDGAGINGLPIWRMAVLPLGGPGLDFVSVLVMNDPDSMSNEELYVVNSLDGGLNFGAPELVPQGFAAGAFDIDDADIAITPDTNIHVVFSDDRSGMDQVYYQRSIIGSNSWLASDVQLSTVPASNQEAGALALDQNGSTLAAVWTQVVAGMDEVRLAVSTNSGATFGADNLVATAAQIGEATGSPFIDESPMVGIFDNGNIVVAYQEGTTFLGTATAVTTTDNGMTFGAASTFADAGFPQLAVQGNGACIAYATGLPGDDPAFAAATNDAGATWSGAVVLSENPAVADADFVVPSYNGLNDNAIVIWRDDTGASLQEFKVGGFRPQTVTAVGWDDIQNAMSLQFDCTNFGGDDAVFIVLSASTGPVPVGTDGRTLCVGADFVGTFAVGIFTAPLVGGNGNTPTLPNIFMGNPPLGITLNYAGIGFSLANGAGKFSDTGSFQI